MMIPRLCGLVLLLLAAVGRPGLGQQRPSGTEPGLERALAIPTTTMLRAYLGFLADDALRGRAPGTPGGDITARYVSAQFEAAGLQPGAPDGSYLQVLQLIGTTAQASFMVGAGPQTLALEPGGEVVAWPARDDSTIAVDGEIVFAGYGIRAPEWAWDDYGEASVAGKILLLLAGEPSSADGVTFDGQRPTPYGTLRYKIEQASRVGALGVLVVHPDTSAVPWSAVANTWQRDLLRSASAPPLNLSFAGWVSERAARRISAVTGRDFDLLVRRARQLGFRPMTIGAHGVMRVRAARRQVHTANIIGRIPGSDPKTTGEVVVLAHYDHLGVAGAAGSDSIFNGAVDNASGVAELLAVAQALKAAGPMRRTTTFLATTGAESDHAGSEAFLHSPTVARHLIVAALNLEHASLGGATRDVVGLGAEESTLSVLLRESAAQEGLDLRPDSAAESWEILQLEHLPFASVGVPSMTLQSGYVIPGRDESWGARRELDFRAHRYHQQSDEVPDNADTAGLLQQVRVIVRLAFRLAQSDVYPTWSPSSPFRRAGEALAAERGRSR